MPQQGSNMLTDHTSSGSSSSLHAASSKASKAELKAMAALKADFKAVCDEVRAGLSDRCVLSVAWHWVYLPLVTSLLTVTP